MRKTILGALLGLALIVPQTASAAPVAKTGVCHYDKEAATWYFIMVPTKQLDRGKGHARHSMDYYPAVEGDLVQGVSCPREVEVAPTV